YGSVIVHRGVWNVLRTPSLVYGLGEGNAPAADRFNTKEAPVRWIAKLIHHLYECGSL
ncbi:hypothetical protein TNCV_4587391, partial [Trichonephila clavipes]